MQSVPRDNQDNNKHTQVEKQIYFLWVRGGLTDQLLQQVLIPLAVRKEEEQKH